MSETHHLLQARIPKLIYDRAKAQAAEQGVSLTEWLFVLIAVEVGAPEPEEPTRPEHTLESLRQRFIDMKYPSPVAHQMAKDVHERLERNAHPSSARQAPVSRGAGSEPPTADPPRAATPA